MPHRSPWSQFLHSNGPLPIAIVCLLIAGAFIDEPRRLGAAWSNGLALLAIEVMLVVGLKLVVGTTGQIWLGQAAAYAIGVYAVSAPMAHGAVALDRPLHSFCWYASAAVIALIGAAAIGQILWLVRLSGRLFHWLRATLLGLLVLWCIVDVSIVHLTGDRPWLIWPRLPGLAAAAHGAMVQWSTSQLPQTGPTWAGMLVLIGGAATAGGAVGWVIGLAACNRSPKALLLLGLVLAAAAPNVLWTDPDTLATAATSQAQLPIFTWCAIVATLAVIAVWRVRYSNIGRAMLAVRENALAAATVGVEPERPRMLALVLCMVVAAAAGALRTQVPREIGLDEFSLLRGMALVAAVAIGGMHSISGAVLAAMVLGIVPTVWPQWQAVWYGALGVAMVVMLRLRPEGVFGRRELWPVIGAATDARQKSRGEDQP